MADHRNISEPFGVYEQSCWQDTGEAKLTSATRRLSRLLDNPAIRVRAWYEPIAREWLEAQFRCNREIRLIIDGTKIGFGHQLLIVCLAYRKRSIPIAWTWVKHVRGHSTAGKQLALLAYVRKLLPQGLWSFWLETPNSDR